MDEFEKKFPNVGPKYKFTYLDAYPVSRVRIFNYRKVEIGFLFFG
jgi:hypothetical protein